MLHATAFLPPLQRREFSHILCMYEEQACQAAGSEDDTDPAAMAVREFAYSGLYQLGAWENHRHADKSVLWAELQGQGIRVPPGKKLIFYCGGLLDNPQEQCRAVLHLSRHYFVIFKPYYFLPRHEALLRAPSVFVIRDTVNIAPNAMRFAADYILASPFSGVFTTCLMLGLRIVPLLTEHQALELARNTFIPWRTALEAKPLEQSLAKTVGGTYSTTQLPALAKRIEDETFWREYTARLPQVQRTFFGGYRIEGSAAHTARLLLRIALRGSFGKDAALIRPYVPASV